MSTATAVHELLVCTEFSIGMRQNLVFVTYAHRKPVKFDQHRSYNIMVTASCLRIHSCACIL